MIALDKLTTEQLSTVTVGPAMETVLPLIRALRLASALMAAEIKLAIDVEGEATAWANLRDMLATATERARLAEHPSPRSAG